MLREKVAISIRKDVLRAVEKLIDGSKIRNRSQAIEHLIMKSTTITSVNQAVIIEHGHSHHPHINNKPIPLALLKGKTLLERNIRFLIKNGVDEIFVLVEKQSLEEFRHLIERKRLKVKLLGYGKEYGTAGRLKIVESLVEQNFIMMNGDCLTDFDLNAMVHNHLNLNPTATVGLIETDRLSSRNVIKLQGNKIIDYGYLQDKVPTHVTSSGIYVINKRIFDLIDNSGVSLEEEIFPTLAMQKNLNGYLFSAKWWHFHSKDIIKQFHNEN